MIILLESQARPSKSKWYTPFAHALNSLGNSATGSVCLKTAHRHHISYSEYLGGEAGKALRHSLGVLVCGVLGERRGTSGLEESREADFALDVHCLLVDLQLGLGLLASILEVALPLLRRLGSVAATHIESVCFVFGGGVGSC